MILVLQKKLDKDLSHLDLKIEAKTNSTIFTKQCGTSTTCPINKLIKLTIMLRVGRIIFLFFSAFQTSRLWVQVTICNRIRNSGLQTHYYNITTDKSMS